MRGIHSSLSTLCPWFPGKRTAGYNRYIGSSIFSFTEKGWQTHFCTETYKRVFARSAPGRSVECLYRDNLENVSITASNNSENIDRPEKKTVHMPSWMVKIQRAPGTLYVCRYVTLLAVKRVSAKCSKLTKVALN